jgi:thiamine-phosphate pyrophosphorylase
VKSHTDHNNAKRRIERLQYLTQDGVDRKTHAELVGDACRAGIKWVQFRTKNTPEDQWEPTALEVQEVAKKYDAVLIINDNVALAKKIGADGVHLGKEDMSVKEARKILGDNFIIGGTANTAEDIKRLVNEGADYIGLGPYRFTTTKKNLSPVLGHNELLELLKIQNKIPIILIGGITAEDIPDIAKNGAYGAAVSSAINLADNPGESAKLFHSETLKHFKP